jgi:hypothetical protein
MTILFSFLPVSLLVTITLILVGLLIYAFCPAPTYTVGCGQINGILQPLAAKEIIVISAINLNDSRILSLPEFEICRKNRPQNNTDN